MVVYLLAVPVWLTHRIAAAAVFIQMLAAAKYFLAWRIGMRAVDARFGLAFAVGMVIAGWSTAPLLFPSHPAVVETTILFLVVVTWRSWERFSAGNALLFGLAAAACLHAHPTTLLYILVASAALLLRYRSWSALGLLGVAAAVVALSLLPPWLDNDLVIAGGRKSIATYANHDFWVNPWSRIPRFIEALFVGGAWSGLLLMTHWKLWAIRVAWTAYCVCLATALSGVLLLRPEKQGLRRWCMAAFLLLFAQVVFLVFARLNTPIWMVPSCLPPLALIIAIGWYGWFNAQSQSLWGIGISVLPIYLVLALAPFGFFLRDVHSARVMPHANPDFDIVESEDIFKSVPVSFVPARKLDLLATAVCNPSVLHGRLAAVFEYSFGTPMRNACGQWPNVRFAGTETTATHLAGILQRAAITANVLPDRFFAGMAFYEHVHPIAPASGASLTRLQRMQVLQDAVFAQPEPLGFEFDAQATDVVLLTNRKPGVAPMNVHTVTANANLVPLLYDDGGSLLYRCDVCANETIVHWRMMLSGVEQNLDLVVVSPQNAASDLQSHR